MDEAATALPMLDAVRRAKRRGEIDRDLDDLFIVAMFPFLALTAIGLIERTGADEDRMIADAQQAFRKAVGAAKG